MRVTDDFVFFVNNEFSNWAPSPMVAPNYFHFMGETSQYNCVEQYMMAHKAAMFGDEKTHAAIMKSTRPAAQKTLGRAVKNFNAAIWNDLARPIVYSGAYAKFSTIQKFRESLLDTGDRIIVEAAHYDRVWGVGLHENDALIDDPANWKGSNWLGQVLMRVRSTLQLLDMGIIHAPKDFRWSNDPTRL